jgi:saccharopine dehydrogenase-like NADP-dependent oxidoreductase
MSTIAIIGAGTVGIRVARQLAAVDEVDKLILGTRHPLRIKSLSRQLLDVDVEVIAPGRLPDVDTVVLALPAGGHAKIAEEALSQGAHVVSISDSTSDIQELLELNSAAEKVGKSVVVGAGFSPGLSCLIARHATSFLDQVDEVHIARMGTGGPACQRQLHRARAKEAIDWHDGHWRKRPGGSGRELVWFPDPLGARDCYRAALADAILLVPAMPDVQRITSRIAATRRDRLTAWLPMLRRPHVDGGPGALRIEVRGKVGQRYQTEVFGVIDQPSAAAACVSALAAEWVSHDNLPRGVWGLGMLDDPLPWLIELALRGVEAAIYEGVSNR